MPIQLLGDHLVNKIAAGEVIEKPAAVVKELLENAIDAGASRIGIRISGGGLTAIEVEDDGQGIPFEEMPLAFQRHATSKIRAEEDLDAIMTMGFRGEALPSIAAVARVQLISRTPDDDGGSFHIEGGQVLLHSYYAASPGTIIRVEELFYNTPARKKFLKSPVSEWIAINDLVSRYGLARPDISISLSHDGRLYFKTPGNGSLQDAITAIYGSDLAQKMLPFQYQGQSISVSGLLSPPEIKKSNRKMQWFFVNHRPIRSPILYRTIDSAYQGLLVSREFPVVMVSLIVEPCQVDINVHPQKSEVRFRRDQDIFRVVQEVVKQRLKEYQVGAAGYGMMSSVLHAAAWQAAGDPLTGGGVFEASLPCFQTFTRPTDAFSSAESTSAANHEAVADARSTAPFRIIGHYRSSYILVEMQDALFIVDQHAAHERILFSRFQEQSEGHKTESQELAFPQLLELSGIQMDRLEKMMAGLDELGFGLETLGHNTILIRAVPGGVAGHELEIITAILDAPQQSMRHHWQREAIVAMACHQAVKAGAVLSPEEMAHLMDDLLKTRDYRYCPHGRPTLIQITDLEMLRMFKR